MDTLAYALRLTEAGIPREQADAHAEAARDHVMVNVVTKPDLDHAIADVRRDIASGVETMTRAVTDAKRDMTLRLGAMLVVGLGLLGAYLPLILGR